MIRDPGTYRQYPHLILIKLSLQRHAAISYFKPFAIHVDKRDIILGFQVENCQV